MLFATVALAVLMEISVLGVIAKHQNGRPGERAPWVLFVFSRPVRSVTTCTEVLYVRT